MAYASQSDLVPARLTQQELVELTDDSGTGEVDTTVVTAALDRASGTIDSYAGMRYDLPLTASQQVKDLCLDLGVYHLFERRRRIPEDVQKKRDQAMAFLKDVSASRASMDQPAAKQTSALDVATKDHTTDPDTFDSERLKDF